MAMKGTARRPSAAQEWAAAGPIWLDSRAAERSIYAHAAPIWGRTSGGPALSVTVRGGVPDPIRLDPWTRQVDAGTWEFSATLVVDGWPQGRYELEIEVAAGAGESASQSRAIVVDREAAYEPHRARARAVAPAPGSVGGSDEHPSLLVAAVGSAGERVRASLGRQSLRRFESADVADLEGALRALLASAHEWLLVVEEEGELAPGALAELAGEAGRNRDADAIYADDEWELTPDGATPVRLKPAWSPELLVQSAYAGPVALIGRAAAAAALSSVAGPPGDIRGLLLRLDTGLARVLHLPRSLFVRHGGAAAEPERGTPPAAPPPDPLLSVVICTTYRDDMVLSCIASLADAGAQVPLELVLVDNESERREAALSRSRELGIEAQAVAYPQPFNFSVANNLGAELVSGSELLFLNDDIEASGGEWLERMRAWLHRPGVGVVGAKLLYPSGRIQHAGVAVRSDRIDNLGAGWPGATEGPAQAFTLTRNTTAVTGACMLIERRLFDDLGGFEPSLTLEFGDVDLPLRAAAAGARTVCTPEAELVHHESITRGGSGPWTPGDWDAFQSRWEWIQEGSDSFMSPGFDPRCDFEPATSPAADGSAREPLWARAPGIPAAGTGSGAAPAGGRAGVLSGARAESRMMIDARGSARDALESVLESRTWRYTRPLRRLGSLLRGR